MPIPVPTPPRGERPVAEVGVYRFYNDQSYFWTTNEQQGQNLGLNEDGLAFTISAQAHRNEAALYSCTVGDDVDHFLSLDQNCEGQRTDDQLGFVAQEPTWEFPNALLRCYSGSIHLLTTDAQECVDGGYQQEATLGYVR